MQRQVSGPISQNAGNLLVLRDAPELCLIRSAARLSSWLSIAAPTNVAPFVRQL